MSSTSSLFQPITVGAMGQLKHRVVMPAMARLRASDEHDLPDLAAEYYSQRGSVPGTLVITEGIAISPAAAGLPAPGLWRESHRVGWKKVTDAVHTRGSFVVGQIYGSGTGGDPNSSEDKATKKSDEYVKKTDWTYETDNVETKPLTLEDIQDNIKHFGETARFAIEAGFDGVEMHMANGFLLDQFIQTNTNTRRDEYGGSVENRLRFALEATEAVVQAVGQERVGLRVSPWSKFQGMGMPEKDIQETFGLLFKTIKEKYPKFAYVHVLQPRIGGPMEDPDAVGGPDSDAFLREIWTPLPYIASGGFNRESAIERADSTGNLVGFGRQFLANPDLPARLERKIALNKYDRSTFFVRGAFEEQGYTDYPFATEFVKV